MRWAAALSITVALAGLVHAESAARAEAPPRVATPDLLYFRAHVAPILHARCSGCHSDPESGGRFPMQPLRNLREPELETVRANFRNALRFLNAEDPARSRILVKVLGGRAHGGGVVIPDATHPDFERLRDFALGASLTNRPPEAILPKRMRADAGEPVSLDGTLSADPEGGELHYDWEVVDAPSRAEVSLESDGDGLATLRVDQPGAYRVRLHVHDGALWSAGVDTLVVAAAAGGGNLLGPPPAKAAKDTTPFWKRRLDPERLRLVRRLFLDLLWRTPRLAEIEQWYTTSHEEMVDALLVREEVWDAWYERQLYYFLLLDRFRPKEGRLASLPGRLAKKQVSIPMALQEIVRSQYFNARNPGNDTFVTVVLEQCLGMVVQERKGKRVLDAGKKMYDGYKTKLFREKGNSQADFVRIVFAQEQFASHLLKRMWKDLHGTEIDKKVLKAAVARAAADPKAYRALMAEWLKGEAYAGSVATARKKQEIPYVRSLFVDILDRTPTYDELRNVRNAFLSLADPTPIRLVMGRVLMESGQSQLPAGAMEAERFVTEQFIRLLARQPVPREKTAFVNALKNDPAVTPRIVLWTLISSAEYQGY